MKKIYFFLILLLAGFASEKTYSQVLVKENFDTLGALKDQVNPWSLTKWTYSSGTESYTVTADTMHYTGYLGGGNRTSFVSNSTGIINLPFGTAVTSGTLYTSLLIKMTYIGSEGSYFFGFNSTPTSTSGQRCLIYAKKLASGKVQFGLGSRTTAQVWSDSIYSLNKTYLMVIRYKVVAGTVVNDEFSFIVNPEMNTTEPDDSLWVKQKNTWSTDINPGCIFIRSRGSGTGSSGNIAGIRITKSWNEVVQEPSPLIFTSVPSLTGFKYDTNLGPSAEQTFSASGSNLEEDIVVKPSAYYEISSTFGSGFGVDSIVLTRVNKSVASTPIYVRLKAGFPVGQYADDIVLTTSSTVQKVACSGSVSSSFTTDALSISNMTYSFGQGPSKSKTVNVYGMNMEKNVVVTPPDNFEISLAYSSGYVSTPLQIVPVTSAIERSVYVRLKSGLAVGNYSGNILFESEGLPSITVTANGTVTPSTGIFEVDGSIIKISTANGKLFVSGLNNGELIEVYNQVGKKMISEKSNNGVNTLNIDSHGVYILKIGNHLVQKVVL